MDRLESWSGLYRHRNNVKARYPRIWDVPLVKKEMDRLLPNIKDGDSVLEVGAGDRRFEAKIMASGVSVEYRSMDIDPETRQDYRSLDGIAEGFDLVFMFELIEHLTPDEGLVMLKKVRGLLKPGGRVLIGTPNLYHPHRYFGDITHKTPYKYEELGALMMMAGFGDINVYRVYNDAYLRRAFRLSVGIWLHKYLDIDFAGSILAEGAAG
ncbi:MAG: methyltransferase domain-containing protein [Nitrospirae bacterium]|nr:methyltransferase domain-containing protein [Nitrospirota bacterium]MBI5694789.1 methyltransferase domain-containing protein [Nitrospirota bacterium]